MKLSPELSKCESGSTLYIVDAIKTADWVIDPGGEGGGRIVAEGPPEAIPANAASHTGRYLAQVLPVVRRRAA